MWKRVEGGVGIVFLLGACLVPACTESSSPTGSDAGLSSGGTSSGGSSGASSSGSSGTSSSGSSGGGTCKPEMPGETWQQCFARGSDAACDVKANPPRCVGGRLWIKCFGECKATAGATVQCRGACDAECSECDGKPSAPGTPCTGMCTGTCNGSCKATAQTPVECDGACTGDIEILCCEGGQMEWGCMTDAKCVEGCADKARCTK